MNVDDFCLRHPAWSQNEQKESAAQENLSLRFLLEN